MPFVPLTVYIGGPQNCYILLFSCCELGSLNSGEFPSALKQSLTRQVLKKPDRGKDVLKNYRPVANIPFLAEVTEKVVAVEELKIYQCLLCNPPTVNMRLPLCD